MLRLNKGATACEFVVETRLVGDRDLLTEEVVHPRGLVWAYMQNNSDVGVKVPPAFVLTAGLRLPWITGLKMMQNVEKGQFGEVLSWLLPNSGDASAEAVGNDIARIVEKCKRLMDNGAG